MCFDKIGHDTGLLHKIKFYCVYNKFFFLLSHFLVVKDYELYQSTSDLLSVSLTLEYVRILSWSISFFFSIRFLRYNVLSKICSWSDDAILNSSCDKASDLLQQVNLILKIKSLAKYSYFSSAAYFLILKCKDLVLKIIRSSSNVRSFHPEIV